MIELDRKPGLQGAGRRRRAAALHERNRAGKDEVSKSLKSAHVDLYVGDNDIIRRIPPSSRSSRTSAGSGPQSVEVDLDLKLDRRQREQEISAPPKSKPISDLFIKLGINPIELLGALPGRRRRRLRQPAGRTRPVRAGRLAAAAFTHTLAR